MSIDLFEIVQAWITASNPSEDEKKLAKKRSEICNLCEHKKEILKKNKLGIVCSLCGCPLQKKVFSNKNNPCPVGKWRGIDSEYYSQIKKSRII